MSAPFVGAAITIKVRLLSSLSLPFRMMASGVPSVVVTVFETATGASLTGVTVIEIVESAEFNAPSLTRNVKLSLPLKSAVGV